MKERDMDFLELERLRMPHRQIKKQELQESNDFKKFWRSFKFLRAFS
jgi:hypothetical protein